MSTFPHAAVIFALISAFLFALTNHFQSLGLEGSDSRTGSIINIATGAVFYWLLAPFYLESWYWFTWGAVLFALVGIIRPSISSFLAIQSIHVMGPTLTSALTASSPIFGAISAVFLLGEELDLKTAIGILAVVSGAVVATYRPQGIVRDWPLWALALPLGAAFVRVIGHTVTKIGLEDVPSPSFAVMLSNTVSLVIALTAFGRDIAAFPEFSAADRHPGGCGAGRLRDSGFHDAARADRFSPGGLLMADGRDNRSRRPRSHSRRPQIGRRKRPFRKAKTGGQISAASGLWNSNRDISWCRAAFAAPRKHFTSSWPSSWPASSQQPSWPEPSSQQLSPFQCLPCLSSSRTNHSCAKKLC
jgi:uncharacterized membrane protein